MSTGKTLAFSLTCLLFLLLPVVHALAQNAITLKGRILNGETNEPLPFATVSIPESQTGVISNEFGEFQYHIPANFENRTVMITYIGYKPVQIRVSEIETGKLRIFRMEEQAKALPQVEVKGTGNKINAVNIVRKAIVRIRKNYATEKTLLYGYYRDYASPVGTHAYKNLIEAALVIEDRGFQTGEFSQTRFKLEQLRYNPEVEVDSSLNKAYDGRGKFIPNFSVKGANELAILRANDPIRTQELRNFSPTEQATAYFALTHNFSLESIAEVDSDQVYCIHFDKDVRYEETRSEYHVDGRIYISSKSFAILKFNYLVTCKTPGYSGKFIDLKVEYRNYGEKYYLNYLSLMNYFVSRSNAALDTIDASAVALPYFQYRELFINKIVKEPFVSLKPHEKIDKSASLLSNKVPVIEGFWGKYNYTGVTELLE